MSGVNTETSSLKKEESNANSDGLNIGQSATDKIGFYAVSTPIVQRSGASQAAVATTSSTTSTPYGYTSATQADGVITLLNEIRATLVALGLMKGSA